MRRVSYGSTTKSFGVPASRIPLDTCKAVKYVSVRSARTRWKEMSLHHECRCTLQIPHETHDTTHTTHAHFHSCFALADLRAISRSFKPTSPPMRSTSWLSDEAGSWRSACGTPISAHLPSDKTKIRS